MVLYLPLITSTDLVCPSRYSLAIGKMECTLIIIAVRSKASLCVNMIYLGTVFCELNNTTYSGMCAVQVVAVLQYICIIICTYTGYSDNIHSQKGSPIPTFGTIDSISTSG